MTEIMQLIHRYRDGEMGLDELADLLASREYREPSLYGPPPPGITAEEHALEQLGVYPEVDTWDEVSSARVTGLLTREEYEVVSERTRDADLDAGRNPEIER